METLSPNIAASRIVVIMPNWLGDGVMATPLVYALRQLYPEAHLAGLARPIVTPVLEGSPCVNEIFTYRKGEEGAAARWLRAGKFELGLLLPNSFRSAVLAFRGGIGRRLGYARGGRSMLMTDRVRPVAREAERKLADQQRSKAIHTLGGGSVRVGSPFQPMPTIDYYLELARHLNPAMALDRRMRLFVTEEERGKAGAALTLLPDAGSPLVVMVPGANFGSSKCWEAGRFAAVADRLMEQYGARIVLASSPAEGPIVEAILAAVNPRERGRVLALAKLEGGKGLPLAALKPIVQGANLMIANDTGPRHFAAAFDVPVVTLFGPTDPVWAETYAVRERIVRVGVPCGPCQLKTCPIDHRCMSGISVEMVMQAVEEVWPRAARGSGAVSGEAGGKGAT